MRLVFMVEELSMKELLQVILPKILPEGSEEPLIIPHSGREDLRRSIPIKLQAWQNPEDKFIIVCDQDSNDCVALKKNSRLNAQAQEMTSWSELSAQN